jgi:imidazolonepropionase-like amidohydrolase
MISVKGKNVYTGDSVKINSYINFKDSKVYSITEKPEGVVAGEFHTITPAFIDAHCHIGMFRAGEPAEEADVNDHMDSILPLIDALDSIQMDDTAFKDSIEYGVLYSCVLPGSGNIIGGMSAVIRNYGFDTNDAFIASAGLKAAFGYNTMSPYSREKKGRRASTRMGCIAILRSEFYKVMNEKKEEKLSAEQRILKELLDGQLTLRVHVHKSDDIAAVLRLVDEFNLKITIEHACNVYRKETFEELAKRNIPVVCGPIEGIGPKVELKNMNWRNLKVMIESGVKFGVMTDHDINPQCNLFYVTRHLIRSGISKEQAIESITKTNAEIIGIDDILGTLTRNKWASFTCWNGDPFSMLSYPEKIYAEGRVIFEESD